MLDILLSVLNGIALLIIAATILPLFKVGEWWIRIFDFPRVQILVVGLAVALGLCLLGYASHILVWLWVVIPLIGCLIYQARRIYFYTPLASKQALDSRMPEHRALLRILVANVLMHNRDASTFLDLVHAASPDMILTTEPDRWWEEQLASLETSYPYTIKKPLDNTYGMLLYSRLTLHHSEIRFLVEDSIPSFYTEVELRTGDHIEFYGLHPRPPHVGQDTEERDAEILLVGREAADAKQPVVVAGDLNDVAWSYTTNLFQKVSRLVDPRIGRGLYNTFHAQYPFLRFPVDHVFHSSSFRLVEMKRLPYFGSDHFPILAVLAYEPDRPHTPEPPQENHEDRQEAQELIHKGTKE